ncbi:hypothetical protein P152DRAFT_457716 [Eremomyces bilateralis CBS 781.70]|uniref:Zn(2)-C6 fungal-type domain-containing protein n=1 Tax=Eremomyces bilateralis CBS 781.70 TaxID=1392243 RepID=A0A6G1G5M6_9PEZI|nr:uncharacterized protein P152DRAFT_457716 [Eremomyces bilateralis CBS 781.70]KAF1813354.1 hypothetical protein P152DRAFT_457716 [Eremomyces bilateralis CBS 781.70]
MAQTDEVQWSRSQFPWQTIPRACQECHRKKTKCDMSRPACGLCRRTGSKCYFPIKRKPPSTSNKRRKTGLREVEGNMDRLLSVLKSPRATYLLREHGLVPNPSPSPGEIRDHDLVSNLSPRSGDARHHGLVSNLSPTAGDAVAPDVVLADSPSQSDLETVFAHDLASLDGSSVSVSQLDNGTGENVAGSDVPASTNKQAQAPTKLTTEARVSCDVAMHLVEVFFLHIQPWLPLLHRPRFTAYCSQHLSHEPDALSKLPVDMKLLLYSLFALSARHSNSPHFDLIDPRDRDEPFMKAARHAYAEARSTKISSLQYVQGCILLAFNDYTSELNAQSWILTGVCVRLAYEMELFEIDDPDSEDPQLDSTQKEEMRRAWWLIWELDTFGSMVSQRPFAVDRHQFSVNLPVSDNAWFSGNMCQSALLMTSHHQCWKSLQAAENQDPRAWFLVANHLLSLVYQELNKKKQDLTEVKYVLEVSVNCFRLSLPPEFNISTNLPTFDQQSFGTSNWIMGTHLLLNQAYAMIEMMPLNNDEGPSSLSCSSQVVEHASSAHAKSFTRIITRWPTDYLVAAHPFFLCMMLPIHFPMDISTALAKVARDFEAIGRLAELIFAHFAGKWKLASETLAVLQMMCLQGGGTADHALVKRFSVFFPRRKGAGSNRPSNVSQPGTQVHGLDYAETVLEGYNFFGQIDWPADIDNMNEIPPSLEDKYSQLPGPPEAPAYEQPLHERRTPVLSADFQL